MPPPLPRDALEGEAKPSLRPLEPRVPAESSLKPGDRPEATLPVIRGAIRASSPDPSLISLDGLPSLHYSGGSRNEEYGHFLSSRRHDSRSPARPQNARNRIQRFWVTNKGLVLVLMAQLFGTLMNVTTRMLEMEGNKGQGYHPFQILFVRMLITVICASFYMWYTKTEHFPWGMREVRPLLVARGFFGFFGVFGMYYSLMYLPLADATVITFLSPSLACWVCSYVIHEPFTRMEQIAAYISLFGVVLIARPISLFSSFSHSDASVPPSSGGGDLVPVNGTSGSSNHFAVEYDAVTPAQRAAAVGIAMLGVIGSAGAYTTIRWIGRRAHPLISVNYFSTWCTIVSTIAMFTVPGVGFILPQYLEDWCYLIFLGICGFVMQFLLAAGLQYEKSSRATNMVYMQMLFALSFDKLVWGTTPGTLSIIGSSLILGSAIYVALHKEQPQKSTHMQERGDRDEEEGLMADAEEESREDDEVEIPLRTMRS